MALRGDPRILLVFSILACNTKINNFFAPHSSSKMPETGAAYILNVCVHVPTSRYQGNVPMHTVEGT